MILNRAERSIDIKVVYYGPALSGKTTNLQALHLLMPERERTPLTSLKTEGDRTLFFDFLPLQFEVLHGWTVRLKTYTVPGQAQYEATRRVVLQGTDGIAFIADSAPGTETTNRTALQAMRVNLKANGLDPRTVPTVLQYNKRDLDDALPLASLDGDLNAEGLPRYEAVAVRGIGVRDTFVTLASRSIVRVMDHLRMTRVPGARLQELLHGLLSGEMPGQGAGAATESPSASVYDLAGAAEGEQEDEQRALLQQAVASAVDLANDLARANSSLRRLARREAELACLAELAAQGDGGGIAALLERIARSTGASAASVLVPAAGEKSLAVLATFGVAADPLNARHVGGRGTLSYQLLAAGRALLTHSLVADLLHGGDHPELESVRAVVAAPIMGGGRLLGLLTLLSLGSDGWTPQQPELDHALAAAGLLVPHVLAARTVRPPALAGSVS